MPVLKLLQGRARRHEYPLSQSATVIGRDKNCHIRLELEEVSRQHAEILREEGGYLIVDLHSRNRTYLNGTRLEPNNPTPLNHSDLVKICGYIFSFIEATNDSRAFGLNDDLRDPVEERPSITLPVDSAISSSIDGTSGVWATRAAVNPEIKLRAMMQIAHDLHKTLGLGEVLDKVLESLLKTFPAALGAVAVLPSVGQRTSPIQVSRTRSGKATDSAFLSQSVLDYVLLNQRAVLSEDLKVDPRFSTAHSVSKAERRSLMCAPLVGVQGRSLGALQLEASYGANAFTESDLDLVTSIAMQIAFAVESTEHQAAAIRQRDMQRDLEVAHEIQLGLLPSDKPKVAGYRFYDFYAPAKEVGGDYYDYFQLPDGRLALVLGDVAGKGVPAALLMAKLCSETRLHLAMGREPKEVMQRLNEGFSERSSSMRFVTSALLILDPRTHQVQTVNAGHMRPIVRRNAGDIEEIGDQECGVPLGIVKGYGYQDCTFTLSPGDLVVIYSDGVTDGMNAEMARFGTSRLLTTISSAPQTADGCGECIIDTLHAFVGDSLQTDDICLLCMGRNCDST